MIVTLQDDTLVPQGSNRVLSPTPPGQVLADVPPYGLTARSASGIGRTCGRDRPDETAVPRRAAVDPKHGFVRSKNTSPSRNTLFEASISSARRKQRLFGPVLTPISDE
jgi:hypothetical protein